MKAILNSTGERIILHSDIEYNDSHEGHYSPTLHRTVWDNEYSIISDVDWSSFRREAAKDILAGMLSAPVLINIGGKRLKTFEDFANTAIGIADVLIAKLKEK